MLKICVLTHTFPRFKNDTTAAFMHSLVLGLKKTGNEVVVLTPYHPQFQKKDFPYKIITYRYFWPKSLHLLGYSRTLRGGNQLSLATYFLAPFLYLFGILALFRLCQREKIDIICSHWLLPNGFMALVVSKLLKIPYTVTLPGSDIFLAKKNPLFRRMAILSASQANAVCADSPQFLDDLKSFGARIKKSEIIPYPVDINQLKPKKTKKEKKEIIILSVCRLVYKKGLEYLLRAAAPLLRKKKNLKLIIIGDGDLHAELKKLANQLKISDQTIFIYQAPRQKMSDYYNLADIFVTSSIKDKGGNMDDSPVSLFEAMACGKPVVATNFPGITKIVSDGVNGFLVPEKNIPSIRGALVKLIQSAHLRRKMGQASRNLAEEKLSVEKIGSKYNQLFQSFPFSIKRYWEERAKNYQDKKEGVLFKNFPYSNLYLHQLQIQEINKLIPKKKCFCLDLGCGYGRLAEEIAFLRPQSFIYGVDFVKDYVDLFNQKLNKRGEAKIADIRYLPFKKNIFDFIWSMSTLNFLEKEGDRQQTIQEIFRVLKPKGKVIFFEPNKLGTKMIKPWREELSHSFDWQEINRSVEKFGGRTIKQRGYFFLTLCLPMIFFLEKTLPFLTKYLFVIIKKLDRQFSFSHFSYWIFYVAEKNI